MPELARSCRVDLAIEPLANRLHAVADAENGDAEFEDGRVGLGGAVGINAAWPAREDESFGSEFFNSLGREVVSDKLAEHVLIANAACDQLGGLRAEIEDQNAIFVGDRVFEDRRIGHCASAGTATRRRRGRRNSGEAVEFKG